MKEEIYVPMSCRIITAGHVKVLEELKKHGFVTVGLLSTKALKGYKKEILPFAQRKYILETIAIALGGVEIVNQESLDPSENLRKYKPTIFASGDGFEEIELKAIKKYKLRTLRIRLSGEVGNRKLYSASKYVK